MQSTSQSQLIFVTGNKNKFAEVVHLLNTHFPHLTVVQSDAPLAEIQADSLEEVAAFKLNSVKNTIQGEFFVEDAGFFVDDQLHGFPGVYSSFVMKKIGWQGILKLLSAEGPRKAHFEAVIGFCDRNKESHFFKGINTGTVALEGRGTSGFGFDPIFLSHDAPTKTYAELGIEHKSQISHRSRAMIQFLEFLEQRKKN